MGSSASRCSTSSKPSPTAWTASTKSLLPLEIPLEEAHAVLLLPSATAATRVRRVERRCVSATPVVSSATRAATPTPSVATSRNGSPSSQTNPQNTFALSLPKWRTPTFATCPIFDSKGAPPRLSIGRVQPHGVHCRCCRRSARGRRVGGRGLWRPSLARGHALEGRGGVARRSRQVWESKSGRASLGEQVSESKSRRASLGEQVWESKSGRASLGEQVWESKSLSASLS